MKIFFIDSAHNLRFKKDLLKYTIFTYRNPCIFLIRRNNLRSVKELNIFISLNNQVLKVFVYYYLEIIQNEQKSNLFPQGRQLCSNAIVIYNAIPQILRYKAMICFHSKCSSYVKECQIFTNLQLNHSI